ncbi:putative phloem protein [Helianthus anomalus]
MQCIIICSYYSRRFAVGTYKWYGYEILKADVKTQFLSPGITYTVNLVFKFDEDKRRFEDIFLPYILQGEKKERRCENIFFPYRLQGERERSFSYLAYKREDGWWACELYHFTTDHRTVDLQILFECFSISNKGSLNDVLQVEGIEFQPLENVEHIDEKQLISDSDSDANWEEKLPVDYEDIMKRSKSSLQWTTKEEAYSIICKGFLISDDETKRGIWFSLDKNGKKCLMLSGALECRRTEKVPLPESRFGEAIHLGDNIYIYVKTNVQSQLVSSETTYACYLVYKLPEDQSGFKAPVKVEDGRRDSVDENICYIYLTSPQTLVIRPNAGQNTHNSLSRPKIKGLPQQRNDGWIEVKIWELRAVTTINMELTLELCDGKNFSGLIIEGIEFKPV